MLRIAAFAACLLFVVGGAAQADEPKLDGVKCPLSGRAIDETKSADYKGGKVYFCCGNCLAKFESDPSAFATKANAQLAATGQAKQTACPFSGRPVNKATEITVAGAKVGFCCNNCKGKAESASKDEQLKMIFSDKAFSKAFKVKKD